MGAVCLRDHSHKPVPYPVASPPRGPHIAIPSATNTLIIRLNFSGLVMESLAGRDRSALHIFALSVFGRAGDGLIRGNDLLASARGAHAENANLILRKMCGEKGF